MVGFMKSYRTKLVGTIALAVFFGVSASAEEFCVTSVGNDYPAKLNRESDLDLRPSTLVIPNNGGHQFSTISQLSKTDMGIAQRRRITAHALFKDIYFGA